MLIDGEGWGSQSKMEVETVEDKGRKGVKRKASRLGAAMP
jgi:hypothetical protein